MQFKAIHLRLQPIKDVLRLISASATLGAWIQVDEMLKDAIVPRNMNCITREFRWPCRTSSFRCFIRMEAVLALTKVPCILLATMGLHVTATPPHPPPAKSDQAPSTNWEIIVKQRGVPATIKFICWVAAFAEILLIVTQTLGYQSFTMIVLYPLGMQMRIDQPSIYGGYIRYRCYQELGRMFTFEMTIMKEHKLVTTGPYAWVRHPAYTGVICTISGIVMVHCASGSWLIECKYDYDWSHKTYPEGR
ncbi:ICMT-domain-containing protein [Lentinula edodes]|uniref:Protein-S-isoprenylcysteine O-methyltransferase n=1 Tax=Lentinula edodes TaxID=5353 RepID=A0A1Q3E3I9_LENED|nr:ICMT-domain-containing protein [Lentinula edodes]